MSATCQSCTAPSADAFLCRECVTTLRANLARLAQGPYIPATKGRTASGGNWHVERRTPGLLDNLADVVLKRTRLGGSGGHRKRGDEMPVPFIPDEEKLDKDGRVKLSQQGRAAELLTAARNSLSTIVRDMCESRGGQPKLADADPAQMAAWLAEHTHALACDESAGQWWSEIDALVRRVERIVDRPVRYELLGVCFTQLDNGKTCDTALRAPEGAIEVRCPKCRTVRRCDIVRRNGQSDARRALITWAQVLEINKRQPEGWRVHERTLRDWRTTGVIRVHQYLRPGGGHGIHRRSDADVPLYKWGDIEQLRSQKRLPRGERKRTRAGR